MGASSDPIPRGSPEFNREAIIRVIGPGMASPSIVPIQGDPGPPPPKGAWAEQFAPIPIGDWAMGGNWGVMGDWQSDLFGH